MTTSMTKTGYLFSKIRSSRCDPSGVPSPGGVFGAMGSSPGFHGLKSKGFPHFQSVGWSTGAPRLTRKLG